MSLAKPGESILLNVDNTVAFSYLKKQGGKKVHLNTILKPLLLWCLQHKVQIKVNWVPTTEMLADPISRWDYDRGDYTLNHQIFHMAMEHFSEVVRPTVDMFASPGNAKLRKFVTRYPHFQALKVDALSCYLGDLREVYANPPWKVITPWLKRLQENKHLTCLFVCPYWVSAIFWPLLIGLRKCGTKCLVIPPREGMFTNCHGEVMPAPKWPLACLVLSGKDWNPKRCRMPTSKIIWEP